MAFYPRVRARKNSAGSTFTRERINVIEGTGITITLADDAAGKEIDLTIAASTSGHTIEEDGTPLTARTGLNFVEGIIATDDAGGDETDINLDWAETGDITGAINIGDAADAGTGLEVPRNDHQHAFPAPAAGYPVDVAATEADGVSTAPARDDHRHAHGTGYRGGHTFTTTPIVFADSPYTVVAADDVILADATGGAITVTLPTAAAGVDRVITVKKTDSSVNSVTIDGNGAETIDDDANQVLLAQYDSLSVISDGTEWWIL